MIRLLLAANDAYAMPMTVAAHSALTHLDRGRAVELNLGDVGLSAASKLRAERVLSRAHPRLEMRWRQIDLEAYSWIDFRQFSSATMIRLLLSDLFPEPADRVLYLDCDLVVEADVSVLWDLDLGDTAVWAVQNGDDGDFDAFIRAGFPEVAAPEGARYFNSGVMLVNLPAWRKAKGSERTIEFLTRNPEKLPFMDQDALNAVFAGAWGRLDARWNKQPIRYGEPEQAPLSTAGVLHFTSFKPWTGRYSLRGADTFHRAYLRTGWDTPVTALRQTLALKAAQVWHRNRLRVLRRLGH